MAFDFIFLMVQNLDGQVSWNSSPYMNDLEIESVDTKLTIPIFMQEKSVHHLEGIKSLV